MDSNHLSLESILRTRGEGFATVGRYSAEIALLANHLEHLDTTLMSHADSRSIDEQQNLVDATRRLASLLNGEVSR